MAETEFKFFAHTLATKYKKRQKVEEFTETLFREIYLPEEAISPIDNTDPRTFRAYYYGQNDITELAKQISGSLDKANFENFVATSSDDTIEYLCDNFAGTCPGINKANYASVIAQRFEDIIDRAAAPKTKCASLAVKTGGGVPAVQNAAMKQHGVFLVAEAGSICPDCNRKPLFAYADGRNELVYDVVVIDPEEPADDTNNLIALCPECAAKYRALMTPLDTYRMRQNKEALLDDFDNQEIKADQKVQEGVRRVIAKIPEMQGQADVDLNYDPVTVRQKIEVDRRRLYMNVKTSVNVYFNDVHEAFQQLGREGKLRFNSFCQQVRYMYITFHDKGYDQDKIFYEMTKWLSEATGEAWGDCEVVISYFVQKCEVFDVITG